MPKDRWDKFHIVSQAFVPLVVLIFTIVFSKMELKNQATTLQLTASNIELAKAEVKASLIPFMTSPNADQRKIALQILKSIDEPYTPGMVTALALSDPDEGVREKARVILGSLSQSEIEKVKQIAEKGADQYDLMAELQRNGLLKKLSDARGYIEGGAPNAVKEALNLYHEVIEELSPGVLKNLDQGLLRAAQEDEKSSHLEHAGRKYRALFQDYAG